MRSSTSSDDALKGLIELERKLKGNPARDGTGEVGVGEDDVSTPLPGYPQPFTRRSAPRKLKLAVAFVVSTLLLAVGTLTYLSWRLGQFERVNVSAVLAPTPSHGPTWLIVGSDSREGIDPDRPDAGGLIGEVVVGQRADTIILVRDLPDVGVQMLSLPRDLWIDPPGDANATRINSAYNQGASELIGLIDRELGVEVHRYAEIDLAGLDSIVDAAGGVVVQIDHPGYDNSIGLRIDESGPVKLDGATALGYVRTRKWTEVINGVDVYDGTGDLGRNQRQQSFLAALGAKLGSRRNPLALNAAISGMAGAVRIDDAAGMRDLYGLARMLQRAGQAPPLPVVDHTTGGGAAVLLLGDGAEEVLGLYRQETE